MAAVTICSDIVKANWFLSAVMYGCEIWTIKKAEHWRIDVFKLWCYRRFLRVPRTARRSDQSVLKETNPEYWLEGLVLKLKLQYFVHLMRKADWLIGKDPDDGKDGGQEEKGATEDKAVECHHWFHVHEFEQTPGDSKEQESLVCCGSWGHKESDTTQRLNTATTT